MPPNGTLQHLPFGPPTKGVIDTAQSSQDLTSACRSLANWRYTGARKLSVRPGTRVVLTLKDDAGTPTTITTVCAIVAFNDGALIVGHSTNTNKAYLYRLNATMDTWTDSGGTTHTNTTPSPIGVLWTSIPNPPEVTVAEGLGVGYIAHVAAMDSASLSFPMKSFTDSSRAIATVTSDLDGDTSAESLYPRGCVSFQQHLWMWSFGAGTTAANAFRPELARFSQPNFDATSGLFATSDSLTLGNRVRSLREGIVGGFVAGDALYLGAPYLVTRITGYGRNSWYKQPLDNSYGFVSQKCGVAAGDTLYYWSPRGPMRIAPGDPPEPLFDAIAATVASVVSPQTVCAGFDVNTDMVIFAFDTGSGVRTWAGFDTRREVWLGPTNDFGLALRAMGTVAPIYQATAAATLGPLGPPTSASTTSVGVTTAAANWTAGDATSPTQVELRQQGASSWNVIATTSAGVQTYTFTGLAANTAYEWRCAHIKDGAYSTYLGPSGSTQFTTSTVGTALNPPTSPGVIATDDSGNVPISFTGHANCNVSWTNSGESGVSTVVEMSSNGGTSYAQQTTAVPGASSATVVVTASGTYLFQMKHTKTSYTDSTYTSPVSVTVTIS